MMQRRVLAGFATLVMAGCATLVMADGLWLMAMVDGLPIAGTY
jgi:hypothetical protein